MRIRNPLVTVVGLALILHCATAKADYIVASNYPSSDPDSNVTAGVGVMSQIEQYNNLAAGQSFTPSADGMLTTIAAQIAGAVEVPMPKTAPALDISLFKTAGNSPTVLLGTVEKHDSDFQSWSVRVSHRYSIDFSQLHISLTAGEQYFIAFQTPIGVAGQVEIWSPYLIGAKQTLTPPQPNLGSFASIAPNWNNWQLVPYAELEIEVHAIPEPTSAALVAFAAMIIGMQRSRKLSTQQDYP